MLNKNLMKKEICYILRSSYPDEFGIRKRLQRLKINNYRKRIISRDLILAAESDEKVKKKIVCLYKKKWHNYLVNVFQEINDVICNSPRFINSKDSDKICDDMVFCRLAYGFMPSEYVSYNFIDKTNVEERRKFASDIDTNIFGYSVNNIKIMQGILDKGECYKKYYSYYNRDAVIVKSKKDYKDFCKFVKNHPVFVQKEVMSSKGKGVKLVDFSEKKQDIEQYYNSLIKRGKHILEERIVQSDEMNKYNPSSVNTIRCITLKCGDEIIIPWCFMKVGQNGSFVDNGGAGGILIGINVDNGVINSCGIDEYYNKYDEHPDTKTVFLGSCLPQWDEMKEFCKNAAKKISGMGYLSWDMAHTNNGWVLVELNILGQLIGPQTVYGKGIKEELEGYFNRMKLQV